MKLLVVGNGGREHAVIKALKKNKKVEKIWALAGNGGIAADAECVAIDGKDVKAVADFAAGNFGHNRQGGLFFRLDGTWRPIRTVEYCRDGSRKLRSAD